MDCTIQAVWRPVHLVGPALTVQAYPQIDTAVSRALQIAKPGDVLVMNRGGDLRHANWGEFAAAGAMEVGIVGCVTDGVVTDVAALRIMNCPTFARGITATTIKRSGIEEMVTPATGCPGGVCDPRSVARRQKDAAMCSCTVKERFAVRASGGAC